MLLTRNVRDELRDTEVENLDDLSRALLMEKNVRWLDIVMDNTRVVGFCERFTDGSENLRASNRMQYRLFFQLLRERAAFQKLHDEINRARAGNPEVNHRDRVRVLYPAQGDALALEPRERFRRGGHARL